MDFQDLTDLIKTRRSVRKFQATQVPEDVLRKALELATWAPNGGNYQAWKFLVVTNEVLINKIADAVIAKTALIASWPEARPFGETVQVWQQRSDFFRHAPVCMAVLAGKVSSVADQVLQAREGRDAVAATLREYRDAAKSALQSVAAAVSYLLLVFHHFGLGATWMTGPVLAKKEIEQLLNVPSDWEFVTLIPVGYPAESPDTPLRKDVTEVVEFVR